MAGQRILSDFWTDDDRWFLYAAEFASGEEEALQNWRFLLDTRSSKPAHPHPFLSPDGTKGFFNSDETGIIQAYMVTGLWNEPTQP
jgi:Tol biopolymer transport system component